LELAKNNRGVKGEDTERLRQLRDKTEKNNGGKKMVPNPLRDRADLYSKKWHGTNSGSQLISRQKGKKNNEKKNMEDHVPPTAPSHF